MAKPRDVREARAFLQKRKLRTADVPPRQFAEASAESRKTFSETLKLVAALQMGTQGRGPAPIGEQIARAPRGR